MEQPDARIKFHCDEDNNIQRVSMDLIDFHYLIRKGTKKDTAYFQHLMHILDTIHDKDTIAFQIETDEYEQTE